MQFGKKSTIFLLQIRKIFSLILTVEQCHHYRAEHVMFLPNRVVKHYACSKKRGLLCPVTAVVDNGGDIIISIIC